MTAYAVPGGSKAAARLKRIRLILFKCVDDKTGKRLSNQWLNLPDPTVSSCKKIQSGVWLNRKGEQRMNQTEIGAFVAKCRKEKKLTQIHLAEKLNITDRAVSKWETGHSLT